MRKTALALAFLLSTSTGALAVRRRASAFTPPIITYLKQLPKQKLSAAEKEDLLKMRQEEKLARDVYLNLYLKWRIPIFRNISRSEQQHMRALKVLIDKYNLKDPVEEVGDEVGVFKDKEFESLYKKLTKQGERSLVDALKVGATIEDLDIKDLEDALKVTDNRDIRMAYQNLMKGSRNHMRAFVKLLRRYGADYQPKYISKSEFEKIINSPHEIGIIYNSEGKASGIYTPVRASGVVVGQETVEGVFNKRVKWILLKIRSKGKTYRLRVAPVWLYGNLNIKEGDRVKFSAYQPAAWRSWGVDDYVACVFEDKRANLNLKFKRRPCQRLGLSEGN